jgi:tricorn protease
MTTYKNKFICFLSLLLFSSVIAARDNVRLLRYADIHKDSVTFVYAGDIYIADINSGDSTRLTSDMGFEVFPKFNHAGDKIAFSAEYSGTRQVYVMNVDGSDLKQLTWYNDVGPMPPRGGYDYRILDWSVDDKNVLVRANRLPWGIRMGQPHWVPVDGGMEQPLAVPETGGGMLSPDGNKFVYTPIDREFRTWKRYRGGRAQDVWIYDLENNTSERLTTYAGTDYQPTWVGDSIYFLSDRDYTINLYKYQKGTEPKKLTNHTKHDSLWASAGPEAVVYENDGYLWRFDPKTEKSEQLKINIVGNSRSLIPQQKDLKAQIESMSISANGKRVVVGARGEIFTVPAKKGEIRNISLSPKAREIDVSWSPDGKYIAYLSDKSGEYEIYLRDTSNNNKEKRLSNNGSVWRFAPVWSPDSQNLAFSDINHILWLVNVNDGKISQLDKSNRNNIQDYSWSPDSRWIAYTKGEDNGFSSIWVYDLANSKTLQLTQKTSNDVSPVFGSKGHYLFFLSDRDYNLAFSSFEFNYLYNKATRIYAVQLNSTAPSLYPFESDEVEVQVQVESKKDKKSKNKKDKAQKEEEIAVTIDVNGFENRVIALSAPAGNYQQLTTNEDSVFFIKNGDKSELQMLSLTEDKKPEVVVKGANDYQLSHDGKKLLVRKGNDFAIVNAEAGQKFADSKLNFKNLKAKIDPKIEWQQLYVDGWRILRDWFYDPNMHGNDWNLIREKYQPWVNEATHRTDLDYIFGEIAGELNAGHIYVNAGDQPVVKRNQNGLLGAEFSKDKSGYFKIDKIFAGENWTPARRSPLTEPNVNAKVGDFVISINNVSTKNVQNIYSLLEHTADRTIEIKLNNSAKSKGSRLVHVRPITSESQLRYLEWINQRMQMVEKLSNGRIGYIHLPNTAIAGNMELQKQFLPQITKDALIVDDRYNGGGFIPDRMIEMLSRKTLNYWKRRGQEPNAQPLIAHDGPKVMLINGQSSSGGDALPYYFRKLGLGKIIGTRTWGGLIGISGNPSLADGGLLLASTFRFMDTEGNWAVENEGVSPDIEVVDRPELVAIGQDPSLERAVKELLKELDENPRKSIKAPMAPSQF